MAGEDSPAARSEGGRSVQVWHAGLVGATGDPADKGVTCLVDEALQKWIFNFASARESSFVSERMHRGHRYIEQC